MPTPTRDINIAVIIINYNSAALLLKALDALAGQTLKPFEVIILDNASQQPLPEEIYDLDLRLKVRQSPVNLGFAGGNNEAIKSLDPAVNWLALLNPDAYPEANWLLEMAEAIKAHPEYAFFGSNLFCEFPEDRLDGTGDAYHLSGKAWRINHQKPIHYAPQEMVEIFSPCAAAALYRLDAFLAVEGFDESFFCYYEDIDLAFRLRLLGYQCAFVPTAIARHTGSATTTRYSDFYTYHGHRNLVWTYFKNMPGFLIILTLPLHLLLTILSIIKIGARGQFLIILKAKWHAFKQFKVIMAERKKWQKRRTASILEIFKIMHKGLPW